MNIAKIALYNALVNIAMVVGVTAATIHFERPCLLWFLLLVVLNSWSYEERYTRRSDNDQDTV